MPWATAPWICPSTIIGLITGPQSSTTAYSRTVTRPVSGSTSTPATCTAPEKVGPGGSKRWVASSPGSMPGGRPPGAGAQARRATSATDTPRSGMPRTLTRPSRSSRSAGLASSSPPAIARSLRRTVARRRVGRAALGDRAAAREGAGAARRGRRCRAAAPSPPRAARRADRRRAARWWWRAPGPGTGNDTWQVTEPSAAISHRRRLVSRHVRHSASAVRLGADAGVLRVARQADARAAGPAPARPRARA